MQMPNGWMFDTVVFNRVVEHDLDLGFLSGVPVFVTHVQRDELKQTPDPDRRSQLLAAFHAVDPGTVSTSSAVWDVSQWGQADWSSSDGVYDRFLQAIEAADARRRKKKRNPDNQPRDALIAETALKLDLVLVTGDTALSDVMREMGGHAATLDEMKATLSHPRP
jgi:hypothetical protein